MSPRASQKKPPVASRRKRAVHLFYLAQPFLQFVALMVVMLVLGRCSPLASSSDKGAKMTAASSFGSPHSAQAIQNAEEADINGELKPLRSADELDVISQSEFSSRVDVNAIDAEKSANATKVQKIFAARAQRSLNRDVRVLVLNLTKEQRDAFFQGSVRINLSDVLANGMAPELRRAYLAELHKLMNADLAAKAYLVLSDSDAAADDFTSTLPVKPGVRLAIFPSDDKAYVELSRTEKGLDDQQQKLIESNKDKAVALALVLQ